MLQINQSSEFSVSYKEGIFSYLKSISKNIFALEENREYINNSGSDTIDNYVAASSTKGLFMILPNKHISFAESLLGFGTFVLECLQTPQNIDALWHEFEKNRLIHYPAYQSFDNLVLTIEILFALNLVEISECGHLKRIRRGNKKCV